MTTSFKSCGTCGEDHESFVRTLPNGDSHAYATADQVARRAANATAINDKLHETYHSLNGKDAPCHRCGNV